MRAHATTSLPIDTDCDTVAVGLFEGEGIVHDPTTTGTGYVAKGTDAGSGGARGALGALVEAGEARPALRHLALTHAAGRRWILVGLGARDAFGPERARLAAAAVHGRARETGARRLCWELPHHVGDDVAAALVEATVLAAYRFDGFRSRPEPDGRELEELVLSAHHDVDEVVARAATVAAAANGARDLQNTPPNALDPQALGAAARELAAGLDGVEVEVEGREGLEARGMGLFAAVAEGGHREPALITLRYEPPGGAADGTPVLGLVGKAVTFDTGGISIKPANKMSEMKFDMSGGAAVLGAVEAIARLRLPVRVVAVVGATENMPGGAAMRPGDVLRAMDGTTVEVLNTDAEGRLVLADCLLRARELGAERLLDLATLTGAIVTALGATHCGLMASDDAWAAEVEGAARRSGELAWRLPLHPDYDELLKSQTADLVNVNEARKAGSIVAAQFLRRFTADVPWAHLDIAGTAYETGRAYTPKGGTGFGVRLVAELARGLVQARP